MAVKIRPFSKQQIKSNQNDIKFLLLCTSHHKVLGFQIKDMPVGYYTRYQGQLKKQMITKNNNKIVRLRCIVRKKSESVWENIETEINL